MADALGKVIKTFRERKGIKRKELAELIHVSAQSISNIEGGKQYPSQVMLESIAKELDVPSEIIKILALDLPESIGDPEKRELIGQSYRNFRFLLKEAYNLV